ASWPSPRLAPETSGVVFGRSMVLIPGFLLEWPAGLLPGWHGLIPAWHLTWRQRGARCGERLQGAAGDLGVAVDGAVSHGVAHGHLAGQEAEQGIRGQWAHPAPPRSRPPP